MTPAEWDARLVELVDEFQDAVVAWSDDTTTTDNDVLLADVRDTKAALLTHARALPERTGEPSDDLREALGLLEDYMLANAEGFQPSSSMERHARRLFAKYPSGLPRRALTAPTPEQTT